jgi:hypothetical protein
MTDVAPPPERPPMPWSWRQFEGFAQGVGSTVTFVWTCAAAATTAAAARRVRNAIALPCRRMTLRDDRKAERADARRVAVRCRFQNLSIRIAQLFNREKSTLACALPFVVSITLL